MNVNPIAKLLLFWYLFIFVSTETLSYFYQLTRLNILLLEAVFWISAFYFLRKQIKEDVSKVKFSSTVNLVIFAILILTFIQGFFSAPSTTDSMVYHLPKVMYWVQERTLFQDVIRNIHDFKAPFAEYIVLHLYFIAGSDRLAFLSQWLAFAVSIYLAGIVAVQLGAGGKLSDYSKLFSATLPIAVLQAASTQVDLVVTVLVLIATHISLLLVKHKRIIYGVFLGITIGLGFLTKATYFIYLIIPFGLLFIHFIKKPERKYLFIGIIFLFLAILIQVRFFYQNYSLYGNLLGKHILWDGTELKYTNDELSFSGISSNIIRNLFVHIPVPVLNKRFQEGITGLHNNFLGVELNDERFTCCGTEFNVASVIYPQEDIVANLVHLLLIFTALFYVIKSDFQKRALMLLTLLAFIIFSAVLKWQPYHSRLEIPIFIIGSIGSVLILGERRKKILRLLVVLSAVLAFSVIILNVSRPFVSYKSFLGYINQFSRPYSVLPEAFYIRPRAEQYFNAEFFWRRPYENVLSSFVDEAKNEPKRLVIDVMDDYEYPVWVILNRDKVNYQVVPKLKLNEAEYIFKTSSSVEEVKDFSLIKCEQTELKYGFACLYVRR